MRISEFFFYPYQFVSIKLTCANYKYTNHCKLTRQTSKMSSDATALDCPICVEPFNRSTRWKVTCTKCDLVCCKTCFKRYITDPDHLLCCMSCGVEFDRASLQQRLGQSWMRKTYRDIRENVLHEQEKSLFPATQEVIENELAIQKLKDAKQGLDLRYEQIRKDRTIPLKEFRYSDEVMTAKETLDKYFALKNNIEVVDDQLQDERETITKQIDALRNNKTTTKRTYVFVCPKAECKGMLSKENKNKQGHYVCSICDGVTCCECRMEIEGAADHTCDENVLATVAYMQSTSKPCPSCSIPIHKISGCNQMFCTSCHCSFSWTTLKINNGAIHNPYHAQWLRETGGRTREIGDVQCGREMSIDVAIMLVSMLDDLIAQSSLATTRRREAKKQATYMLEACRMAVHHHYETLPRLNSGITDHTANLRLRVNLLTNVINEATFRSEIQKRDKRSSKRNDLLHIATTYRDSLSDIVWPFVENGEDKTLEEWLSMIKSIKALEVYINECFARISDVYGSSVEYSIMSDRSIR